MDMDDHRPKDDKSFDAINSQRSILYAQMVGELISRNMWITFLSFVGCPLDK